MTYIPNQPSNGNFLSPLGFQFTINKTPNVNWFVQSINIPGLSLPPANIQTPFTVIPMSGEHITYDSLKIGFRVDEEMKNYMEIYSWLTGTGFPNNYEEYIGRDQSNRGIFAKQDAIKSDATLIILNSARNPIIQVVFKDIAPIALSELVFDTKLTDVNYIQASVEFSIRNFSISSL